MPRVLVVDQAERVRAVVADVLRGSGYNVSVARSGFEAIEIASALALDAIVLNARLPAMDGWATLERLRATRPAAKVVMTGTADDAARAANRGVAFLGRPYRPADLLHEIARAMGDEPGAPARRAA